MKRWEQFNKIFKSEQETAELQALNMVISKIEEEYGIEMVLDFKSMFSDYMDWLNEEVE